MKKVLVIDDSPEIRLIIEETLGMFGFSTVSAEDGETGVSLARRESPDLIICDVNMPKMDGFETLTKLREVEATASIPFMFLSGAVDRPQIRRGMEMGADDYLTKPFTPSELLAAVNARLEKQKEIQRQSEKKLDELRGKMTLALPHELRTPLNGIMGLANILMEDHTSLAPEDIFENAKFIHDSALRLHRLIENFLAYAQIELMSKDPGSLMASAAASVTRADLTAVEATHEAAERHGRGADVEINLARGSVAAIQDNFKKIVEELVDNAFKFSNRGTPVRIVGALEGQRYVVHITNLGRGMTPQQIGSVAPHVQFEREKFEQQGAGLGLIIAKRLTELNGGTFVIQSTPNVETTVTISFPARPTA
ncbi:MAG TPA: hybrid sensor histidine kinase/response regulator [Candidatus Acidoferrum sp.]|nr:hybrid sensor histidine kinase/response regulator [Candidatus Acidoferrum sp.]